MYHSIRVNIIPQIHCFTIIVTPFDTETLSSQVWSLFRVRQACFIILLTRSPRSVYACKWDHLFFVISFTCIKWLIKILITNIKITLTLTLIKISRKNNLKSIIKANLKKKTTFLFITAKNSIVFLFQGIYQNRPSSIQIRF